MSSKRKTLEKIRQNPKHVTFEDVDKVLRWYGFERRQPGKGSSHNVYTRTTQVRFYQLTVPYKRPFVNQFYVKKMIVTLDELDETGFGPEL